MYIIPHNMGVIENLGKLPCPLTSSESYFLANNLEDGQIFPNNGRGYFTSNGEFALVLPSGQVLHLWSSDLLGLDAQNHRLLNTVMDLDIHVYDKRDKAILLH